MIDYYGNLLSRLEVIVPPAGDWCDYNPGLASAMRLILGRHEKLLDVHDEREYEYEVDLRLPTRYQFYLSSDIFGGEHTQRLIS